MKTNPFAHHQNALWLREIRTEMLGANIANADTPNYKARDIDFRTELMAATGESAALKTTHAAHRTSIVDPGQSVRRMYRVPAQPTLDGNTVQTDVEQAEFAENAVRYRASLRFIDGQIKGLRFAIKGGD